MFWPNLRALLVVVTCSAALGLACVAQAAGPISVQSLLTEMTDYDSVARWPDPPYTCTQSSSYDRASKSPEDAKAWFANSDHTQYIRKETVDGRNENVMMDADGPGAIVRFWLTTGTLTKGTIRVYLDGAKEPTIVVPSFDFLNNKALPIGEPLLTRHPGSAVNGRGGNTLYLPIPYAKHCKVTWEEGETERAARYYQINYRTYPAGTQVETYTPGSYEKVNKELANPQTFSGGKEVALNESVAPGKEIEFKLPDGPAAVRALELRVDEAHLRTLIIKAEFDGEETIWSPVGDFFGSGVGLNTLDSWYRSVTTGGALTCRWVMPYQKAGKLTLLNLGKTPVPARLTVHVGDWKWDDRSMHFHANWRQESPIPTRPIRDWNYITIQGQGLYVGDSLAVINPIQPWWGEGDEKIYVDGEKFPSHFGTGTEDYYNYSWCDPHLFQTPFANQVRCDGPHNFGCSVVTRTRNLDAIPFTKSLNFDMEVWHHFENQVGFAVTTYWYGRPGATCNRTPMPDEAVRVLPIPQFKAAIEAETMKVADVSGGTAEPMDMTGRPGYWSAGRQLYWHGGKKGDRLSLEFSVAKAGRNAVIVRPSKANDYGTVQFSLDDAPLGEPVDLYNPSLTTMEPLRLPPIEMAAGPHRLTMTIVGSNPKTLGRSNVGLDYIFVEPAAVKKMKKR